MASDKPYSVGDHITFTRPETGSLPWQGEIVGTAPLVVLDGSQTAYRVRLDGDEGREVGIAHTDVIDLEAEPSPAVAVETTDTEAPAEPAETPEATPEATPEPIEAPEPAAETEARASDATATDSQAAV